MSGKGKTKGQKKQTVHRTVAATRSSTATTPAPPQVEKLIPGEKKAREKYIMEYILQNRSPLMSDSEMRQHAMDLWKLLSLGERMRRIAEALGNRQPQAVNPHVADVQNRPKTVKPPPRGTGKAPKPGPSHPSLR